ncbi:MAG: energy-coupling factor ABC transporter ATP-binding protein, partial [Clostridiales bacterium]|nr:energy-coupling factor ABC transporter ATP-binding protein [Clostridiales bacterium]
MTALLAAEKLSFAYQDEFWLFKDVDFCLRAGEIVGLMGPSGCGKSTLGYCLSGVIPHIYQGNMRGKVFLEGKDISALKLAEIAQKLGLVFQDPDTQLFSATLEDDVVFGPENLCRSRPEMEASLRRSLAATNMTAHRLRNPKTLSGGQAQLAALSAVLALDPRILIFDEAMSHLDQKGVSA